MANTESAQTAKNPTTIRLFMCDISSSLADRLFALSNVVLITGASAVLIGTIGAIVMSGVREQFANERMSANETATAQAIAESDVAKRDAAAATERAALAEQRAAEANLELARLKTPRSLSPDQQRRVASKLRPFAPTRFDVSVIVGDPEAIALLVQIAATLETAGWVWIEWNHPTGPFMTVYSLAGKPNVGQEGASTSVRVEVHADHLPEFRAAASQLIAALTAEGIVVIDATAGDDVPNHDAVHIRIGKKP
jgi:hypothetical protein